MSGWAKHAANPVVGPGYTLQGCCDPCLLPGPRGLRMWFSWRDLHSIAYSESQDGIHWSAPHIVVEVNRQIGWQADDVNRPHVLQAQGGYMMWFTGQNQPAHTSCIGTATSRDGAQWQRKVLEPVLVPMGGWEHTNVSCPFVLYEEGRYRMWYSAGEWHEPTAIGYAESRDGLHWDRHPENPILVPAGGWESARVTAPWVVRTQDAYLMYYVGFGRGYEQSQIGLARSEDGVHGWVRYRDNPVLRPSPAGEWDDCNISKSCLLNHEERWYLWYSASRWSDRREHIGLATGGHVDPWQSDSVPAEG